MGSMQIVKDVVKKYKDFTLGPLSIAFERGKILAVIGPNGAGKTTLLNLLIGTREKQGGKIDFPPIQKVSIVGMAKFPANFNLNKIQSLFKKRLDLTKYNHYIKKFKLNTKKHFGEMSAGQQILSQWAIALSLLSSAIVLDEPFSNIDVFYRAFLYDELNKYIKTYNIPCVITSHNLLEVDLISDLIVFLNNGKIIGKIEKKEKKVNWFIIEEENYRNGINIPSQNKHIIALPRNEKPEKATQIDLIEVFKLIFENEGNNEN